ncbi:MAG: hypothetical protein H6735_12665 [Alphaproteobacteria bacterium]|nr:hypothetical protein [Alphaproteobacteria bacterium]
MDEGDDETLPAPDPTLTFPDDPVHTSVRLNPDEPADPSRTPDIGPMSSRASELGLGRVVARRPEAQEVRYAVDEDPTPIAWDSMETVLNDRPAPPRDFASMLRREDTPIELSDPGEYTLPDVDLPSDVVPDDDEALPTGPTPRSLPPDGYDEVFPVRTDPRLALPAPPPRVGRAGEETRDLLQTGDVPFPSPLTGDDYQPTDAGRDPDEPGTQWMQRPRDDVPDHLMMGRPLRPAQGHSPAGALDRQRPSDEKTEIRGVSGHPSFDDDEAPTVIVKPTPGQFGTPAPEEREYSPLDEPTAPAPVLTVKLPRPPLSEPEPAGWSTVAWAASTLGIVLFVAVVGLVVVAGLRWSGVW